MRCMNTPSRTAPSIIAGDPQRQMHAAAVLGALAGQGLLDACSAHAAAVRAAIAAAPHRDPRGVRARASWRFRDAANEAARQRERAEAAIGRAVSVALDEGRPAAAARAAAHDANKAAGSPFTGGETEAIAEAAARRWIARQGARRHG